MCGLVGILAKNASGFFSKQQTIFQQLLYTDALRGWDATGVFGVTKQGNVDIKKQAAPAGNFLSTPQYASFNTKILSSYHAVIGHNRKATHGEKRHEDAHPFWDEEEKICLVHNGVVRNYKDFCKNATVDSAAIANALATRPRKEVLEEVEGSFVFIWYDVEEKSIYFIKNSDRPLTILETASAFLISSESQLGFWIAHRNDEKVTNTIIIEDMHLYKYTLEEKTITDVETIEKKTCPVILTKNTGMVTKTIPTLHGKDVSQLNLYNTYETMFLVTSDVKTPLDVEKQLPSGSIVGVNITSYVERKNAVRLDCELINVDRSWITVKTFVSKDVFDTLDLTEPHKLEVSAVKIQGNAAVIYGCNISTTDSFVTLNDVIITEDMWFSEIMPCECTVCNQRVLWSEMSKNSVILSNMDVDAVVCPSCCASEKEYNV